ncbi:hypothetical protein AWENTII_002793 [Aspergillus wentii]|nr:hypothetical protein MW887_007654 [Aspergillus wentii]
MAIINLHVNEGRRGRGRQDRRKDRPGHQRRRKNIEELSKNELTAEVAALAADIEKADKTISENMGKRAKWDARMKEAMARIAKLGEADDKK